MSSDQSSKDQQHPQWGSDRQSVSSLLTGEINDYNLAELARLRIRYNGFPGARDVQADLDKILRLWDMTEPELFAKTREIHEVAQVYKGRGAKREDWS
jgi:Protein of unknown function (DUF3288)